MYKKLFIIIFFTFSLYSGARQIKTLDSKYLFSLHFIYQMPKEDNLYIATKNRSQREDYNNKLINMKYEFKPGFLANFAYFIPKTSLKIFASWKEIYSHTKKNKEDPRKTFYPTFWKEGAFSLNKSFIKFSKVDSKLSLYFDSLDVALSENLKIDRKILLNIFGGVKGVKIKQKFNVLYTGGETLQEDGKNISINYGKANIISSSKGMGPLLGINSTWKIWKNLDLLINAQIAFLLNRFNITYAQEEKGYDNNLQIDLLEELKVHEYVWVIRPNSSIYFGPSFSKYWKSFFVKLDCYYEVQHFWEQNLSRRILKKKISYPNKGDLFLSGIGIAGSIKF